MILKTILGVYLFVLAADDMLHKSVRAGLLATGILPVVLSFIPDLNEVGILQRTAGVMPGVLVIVAAVLTKEKIGYGDGIVISIAGAVMGIAGICKVLMLSFLILPAYSVAMLARGRLNKRSRIPFLPFLFAGYLLLFAAL